MKHPAPSVYIDGRLMDDYAMSNRPVLDGLTLTFGTDTDLDMQSPEAARFDILVRAAEELTFIELGRMVAIVHVPLDGEPVSDAFTYFVGRIQRAEAHPSDFIDGAMLYTVVCVDLLTDLAATELYDVSLPARPGTSRMAEVQAFLEAEGWEPRTLDGTRYPTKQHAELHYQNIPMLDLIDAYLRGQLMIRRHTSYYSPPDNTTYRRLDLVHDVSNDTRPDQLTKLTGGVRWGRTPGAPYYVGGTVCYLEGRDVQRDLSWSKEPEDVITEVTLDVVIPPEYDAELAGYADSDTREVNSRSFMDTSAARAEFGVRSTSFRTDLQSIGIGASMINPIFERWLATDTQWRAKDLTINDSEIFDRAGLRALLDPRQRFTTLVVIRALQDNRPDMAYSDIRGFAIGGEAVWNGKRTRWDISLILGRPPKTSAGGDYWTCDLIAVSAFSDGQINNVGDELTFNDFQRIGAP
ncbi:hypothetical protein [Arthrobacter sp. HLT1-21]